jgi:hypothetical protein
LASKNPPPILPRAGFSAFVAVFQPIIPMLCAPFGGRTKAFLRHVVSKLLSLLAIYFAKVLKILKVVVRSIRNQRLWLASKNPLRGGFCGFFPTYYSLHYAPLGGQTVQLLHRRKKKTLDPIGSFLSKKYEIRKVDVGGTRN